MEEKGFRVESLRAAEEQVSQAVTEAARKYGGLAQNCRTVCRIVIGPDGKPSYQCELICDW